jgi:tRNA dimethylallyltransferase
VISPPRASLERRCDARLRAMIADGALEEVERLMARNLDPGLPIMKALGVSALSAQIRGELSGAEALHRVNVETRQYAKRQATWFRNQAGDWRWISLDDQEAQYAELAKWVFLAPDSALT